MSASGGHGGGTAGAKRGGRGHALGGIIHSYQRYDPQNFPPPRQPPGDSAASAAMEHMLSYGSMRTFSEEELRDAIRLDPSQIAGLGPSLDAIRDLLEARKRKILETYDPKPAVTESAEDAAVVRDGMTPPPELAAAFMDAARGRQIRDLERLWYKAERLDAGFAGELMRLIERLGRQYEIEALDAKYPFTGREPLTADEAIEIKEELETIDELLRQIEEALKNAKPAVIDLDALRDFVEEADIDTLRDLGRQVDELLRQEAERQGVMNEQGGFRLSPKAYKLFQNRLLDEIFSELEASRSGRHEGTVGDGAIEIARTRRYEFGDSPTHIDVPNTVVNAAARSAARGGGFGVLPEDIDVHLTKNNPKCATAVLMDMSGSMRQMGQYVQCKRMALALDGLIRSEYPGDYLKFIEMYSLAKLVEPGRIAELLPKPVTIHQPVVRLRADLSDPDTPEGLIPPHFTNIQRSLQLARQMLAAQDTPNRQVFLITDGLPTAHIEPAEGGKQHLYLLYPPDPLTERATMREAMLCKREGITINIFLLPSWSQDEDDVAFAHRLAEQTGGRVFFTAGGDLDRFVLWDYVRQRRSIIG